MHSNKHTTILSNHANDNVKLLITLVIFITNMADFLKFGLDSYYFRQML